MPTLIPLFVDPQNSSGHASDSNDGQTARTPIATTLEFNRRQRLVQTPITSPTTIQYMSEDLQALGPNPVGLELNNLRLHANLTVAMSPIDTSPGGTINAGTIAINPTASGGGQRQTLHTTAITSWGPFIGSALNGTSPHGVPQRVVDSATGGTAWIGGGVGSATASTTRPVNDAVNAATPLTIGDAYLLRRPGVLRLSLTGAPTIDSGQLIFANCAFTTGSVGPMISSAFSQIPMVFHHCAFLDAVFVGGQYDNCALMNGIQSPFDLNIVAGLLVPNSGTDVSTGLVTLSDDVYLTGIVELQATLALGSGAIGAIFITGGAISGSGLQCQDSPNADAPIQSRPDCNHAIIAMIWGNGNAGAGIAIGPGGNLQVAAGTPPTVTGALGDVLFVDQAGNHTTARAWDEVAGAYTTARATTWANFAATIAAGGFNFGMHQVGCNAHLIGA